MRLFDRWRFDRALAVLESASDPALVAYANAPWPTKDTLAREAAYLALDFELDGLRKGAHLLQAGWTPFEGTKLRLDESRSLDIRSDATLDRLAVTVHGIGEQRAARGTPVGEVMRHLVHALAGRILVAHAAAIERTALSQAVRALFGVKLPIRCVCTLALERTLHPNLTGGEAYRLGPTRARYGLPEYEPHDALTDAIAAAELLAAQLSRMPEHTTLEHLESA
ncbi:MAG: exonuclease domain-containing protein [Erythrobacter sp.]|uniref:exonuclease domain-containing protein n=1 Tax=Erythrobacter sp. TaxID=1042 RepID=UPI00260F191C|nr:exonuclease domain-containing protein [Erythrobacter sp.]MDJ0979636.1 exonuclease domain-containing protein [Erythrobacter sp.]